jgi:hypothetical protein
MHLTRRNFAKSLGAGVAASIFGIPLSRRTLAATKSDQTRKMIFGWTTCLTYETGVRKLGFDHFSSLLDEMKAEGMTRLIVMMASHGLYSPGNHGLAWPVKNPKLKPQLDRNALNAHSETEFFSRVIEKARRLKLEVFVEVKYLGLAGVKEGYPGLEFLTNEQGGYLHQVEASATPLERESIESLHICCDSEIAHQFMRDQIRDVLESYPGLDGLVLEHPSYFGNACYCKSSRQQLVRDTGKDIATVNREVLAQWKCNRIRDRLIDLKKLIKSLNSNLQLGFYTGFSPPDGNVVSYHRDRGHAIETLREVGLDFVLPYCEGRHLNEETREIEKVIRYLDPLPVYLHTNIRRDPPRNYPLPPKGPEYIRNIIEWGKRYFEANERFVGMTFFNEVKIPEENRQAVYQAV